MDIIYIHGISIETIIGVHDREREARQTVVIDLEMATDANRASVSDWIGYTADYSLVSTRVIEFVEASEFKLIETLAEKIAHIVMREFGVPWLQLRLSKPGALPEARDVGIVIERGTAP